MRIAVIDLGTNTCNLLISEIDPTGYNILHQSKKLVKLGDNKIREDEISFDATRRTLDAFVAHKQIVEKYNVDKMKVIATSAVRTAKNKIQFLEDLSEGTGWIVKVISGEREAELIFKGVLLAFGNIDSPSVILDIGGGSNELILTQGEEILWKESRPTGMARIINGFTVSNPILSKEADLIQNHFSAEHLNAFQKCTENSVKTLIGCSGAFDTLVDIIDQLNPGEKQRTTQEVSIEQFNAVYKALINSTREERLQMKGMDIVRVDLIVPAVIFIKHLITKVGISKIVQTDFALREGVLFDCIQNEVDSKL